MDDSMVNKIAGESEENRQQREQLQKQLDVLKKGLITCKHFVGDASYGMLMLKIFKTAYKADYSPKMLKKALPSLQMKFYRSLILKQVIQKTIANQIYSVAQK